ncbi:polysaccharide lyase family protein [Ruania albidiflava]|uniref:polysaccharide lyase family protein n=1 Tax=Ruania albidiflava TaxID=366586 RepID=UPI0003B42EE0|nr:polysaccharide lyase family protein [Ruania albidiflava]
MLPEGAEGVYLFDFGSGSSPLAAGYERVADDLLYSAGQGFGLDKSVDSRSRDSGSELLRDFTVGADYTFSVDLPDGEYALTVHSGDAIAANQSQVSVDGGPPVDLSADAGEYATHTEQVTVQGGRLDLTASGDGRINAVEILAADAAVPVLESLSTDGAELVPEFSPFRSDFAVDLAPGVESVTIQAIGKDGEPVSVAGEPVPDSGLTVPLSGRRSEIEIQVGAGDGEPTTYRLHVTTQEPPWQILFDLPSAPAPQVKATLSVWLAAWAMGAALPVPPEESNLTISVNDTPFVWTFKPDDARGATYRSACGGRVYRREIAFDGALLRSGRNEITVQINKGAAHLFNEAAYDAIRLQIAD